METFSKASPECHHSAYIDLEFEENIDIFNKMEKSDKDNHEGTSTSFINSETMSEATPEFQPSTEENINIVKTSNDQSIHENNNFESFVEESLPADENYACFIQNNIPEEKEFNMVKKKTKKQFKHSEENCPLKEPGWLRPVQSWMQALSGMYQLQVKLF